MRKDEDGMLTPSEYAAIGRRVDAEKPRSDCPCEWCGAAADRAALWELTQRLMDRIAWPFSDGDIEGRWIDGMGKIYHDRDSAVAALLESLGGDK